MAFPMGLAGLYQAHVEPLLKDLPRRLGRGRSRGGAIAYPASGATKPAE
jgi:hypothetical protein